MILKTEHFALASKIHARLKEIEKPEIFFKAFPEDLPRLNHLLSEQVNRCRNLPSYTHKARTASKQAVLDGLALRQKGLFPWEIIDGKPSPFHLDSDLHGVGYDRPAVLPRALNHAIRQGNGVTARGRSFFACCYLAGRFVALGSYPTWEQAREAYLLAKRMQVAYLVRLYASALAEEDRKALLALFAPES